LHWLLGFAALFAEKLRFSDNLPGDMSAESRRPILVNIALIVLALFSVTVFVNIAYLAVANELSVVGLTGWS